MKLSQIYANEPFKTVRFNDYFNIILGMVTKPKDKTVDSHNLGKTTLIEVIDFLLLKQIDKDYFLNKYPEKFAKYTFFLEILLNDGKYLTIRRSVANNTKISMLLHEDRYADHTKTISWTNVDLPIKKAKEALNSYLKFDVLSEYSYRSTVSYFLRTQNDYQDVFQLNKFRSSKDIEWKPVLFDLLGFNGDLLTKKYTVDQNSADLRKVIANMESKSEANVEEMDRLKGLIEVRQQEKQQIKQRLDNFNFYQHEYEINSELLNEIEDEISKYNTLRYNVGFKIDKINNSLETKLSFDVKEVEKVFHEVQIYFPDQLKKHMKTYWSLISNSIVKEMGT